MIHPRTKPGLEWAWINWHLNRDVQLASLWGPELRKWMRQKSWRRTK